jgi:hypothetical protein
MSSLDAKTEPKSTDKAENLRIEYQVIGADHIHLVNARFTIAGLYLAATGLLLQQAFSETNTPFAVYFICVLGAFLTIVVAIMEARTRRLIGICAERMRQIEEWEWGLNRQGYMSRIHPEGLPLTFEGAGYESDKAHFLGMRFSIFTHSFAFNTSCYAGTPGIASILLAMPPGMAAIPVRNIS